MKCPSCGYVSFDDLPSCKNCGLSFASRAAEAGQGAEKPRLQDELFSLAAEEKKEPAPAGLEEESEDVGEAFSPESVEEELVEEETVLVPEEDEEVPLPEEESPLLLEDEENPEMEEVPAELVEEEEPPVFDKEDRGSGLLPEEREIPRAGGKEPAPEGAVSLPSMEIDFDPAEVVEGAEETEALEEFAAPGEERIPGEEEEGPGPIIDDDTVLPEDLWVEESAGPLPRLAAFAVDAGVILAILALFFIGALLALSPYGYGWPQLSTPTGIGALFVPFYLLGLFVTMCYYTFFPGWAGRTPGKAVMGLDIHRTDGGPMNYTRAFLRWVGYLVSLTFLGLGFLWIIIDERKRGWHDYLSGTWVKNLRKERLEEP